MLAKCPNCGGVGCDFCKDGFIEVEFPDGKDIILWDRICKDCGEYAGGCYSGPGLPEPEINPHSCCPGCGSSNLELRLAGD